MTEIVIGLLGGVTLGLSAAPLWMMLGLPMRIVDVADTGNMRLCAAALALGATLGSLPLTVYFPEFLGMMILLAGGLFVGMLASALVEAVEVVPVLFDRLSITADMRIAAAALAIGKTIGAVAAGIMGV